jgi:hypothetical protein
MNINYNTSIQGEYTLYDENLNVLCETDNLITDWGMRRFVGDRSEGAPHPADTDESQQAFVNNMRFIMLGTDSTPVSTTDFRLISAIPTTEYTFTNEGATTGTLLSTDDIDGDLLMIFTRMTRFQMVSSFNPSLAPTESYSINEIGCSWSQTLSANNRYGIFSRATLPSPVTVKPNNVIFAKYKLTIKTNANQVLGNMDRFNGTGASPYPNNKTNVRDLPLFTLQSNGEPATILTRQLHFPLFEDAGNHNLNYTPRSIITSETGNCCTGRDDTTLTTSPLQNIWWLQFYTTMWTIAGSLSATNGGSNPLERYNNFTSTTITNVNNPPSLTTLRTGLNTGSTEYSTVINQNLNFFLSPNADRSGRKPADSQELLHNSNTWTRNIKFLLTPNQLLNNITVLKIYRSTLGDWNNDCVGANSIGQCNVSGAGRLFIDSTGVHSWGVVTVFDAPYTPNSSNFEGIQYTFTFTRN